MAEVFISELSGAPALSDVSGERLDRDGLRCGESTFHDRGGSTITIRHCLPAVRPFTWAGTVTWSDVGRQTLSVAAFAGKERVGTLQLKRYNMAQGKMSHHAVWSASGVQVQETFRRRGIASAMYRHVAAHDYAIGPGHKLMPDALSLWRSMDPTITLVRGEGNSYFPTAQKPRIPVSAADFSDEMLAMISDYYRANPTLAAALITDPRRFLQDEALADIMAELNKLAAHVVHNPADLLRHLGKAIARSQGKELDLRRAFARWQLGRPRPEHLRFWRRYTPAVWQRRSDFLSKADEAVTRIRALIDEDELRFEDCSACRGE